MPLWHDAQDPLQSEKTDILISQKKISNQYVLMAWDPRYFSEKHVPQKTQGNGYNTTSFHLHFAFMSRTRSTKQGSQSFCDFHTY